MKNPDPTRISAPLWWFVEKCTSLTATAFSDEYGGTYTNKAGSHNTRNNLIAQGKTNDYSIRDQLNKLGPGDKTAAFDWTFPSAQGGNYGPIVLYSARIKVAWEQKDPRTYALQEVLCEADYDYDPEGYVFYPSHYFRVPDRTHKWHMHFGIIRKFLDDWAAFDAIFSIISGETLAAWKARTASGGPSVPATSTEELVRMFMIQVEGNPTINISTSMEWRGLTSWNSFLRFRDNMKVPYHVVKTEAELIDMAGRYWTADEQDIIKGVTAEIKAMPGIQMPEPVIQRLEAAAREAGGTLTADELRAIMDSVLGDTARMTADELQKRLAN